MEEQSLYMSILEPNKLKGEIILLKGRMPLTLCQKSVACLENWSCFTGEMVSRLQGE